MTNERLQRLSHAPPTSYTQPPTVVREPGPVNVVYVQSQHWIDALGRLHPSAQIAVAVGAGVAVGLGALGLVSLVSVAGTMAATVATVTLGIVTVFSQFVLTVGAGIGILIIVILGIVAILKV